MNLEDCTCADLFILSQKEIKCKNNPLTLHLSQRQFNILGSKRHKVGPLKARPDSPSQRSKTTSWFNAMILKSDPSVQTLNLLLASCVTSTMPLVSLNLDFVICKTEEENPSTWKSRRTYRVCDTKPQSVLIINQRHNFFQYCQLIMLMDMCFSSRETGTQPPTKTSCIELCPRKK